MVEIFKQKPENIIAQNMEAYNFVKALENDICYFISDIPDEIFSTVFFFLDTWKYFGKELTTRKLNIFGGRIVFIDYDENIYFIKQI